MYESILVPLDGSHLAEAALDHAEALASRFQARLVLFHAVTTADPIARLDVKQAEVPPGDVLRRLEQEERAASDYLASIGSRLRGKGVNVETALGEGKAADAILRFVQSTGVSLIVISTHGRAGLGRVAMGSVTDELLHRSATPVLVVRSRP